MAIRLIKLAKELNVGTSTIVDYLTENGYEIQNKPTAKVSEEMHTVLLKEFGDSMAEKEKADQLVLGGRTGGETGVVVPPPAMPPPPPPPVVVPEPEPTPEPAPIAEAPKEEEVIKAPQLEVKVIGKIDLDAEKKKKEAAKKAKEKEAEAKEKKEIPAEVKDESKVTPVVAEVKGEVAAPVDEVHRAATPQLQGLKIMGKVDADKLKEPEKKPAKKVDNSPKKKRKRKKITAETYMKEQAKKGGRNQRSSSGGRRVEVVKEVSKQEIEEKIKQTMAKISGGGKSKRQKIRRGSREEKREKQEAREEQTETGKLQLTEFISVSELASLMNVSATQVITTCMNLGVIVSINQRLDAEIIELVAGEFDFETEFINAEDQSEEEEEIVDDPKDLEPRAPIVTVMGHVDHGKTSLLDFIRSANVADGEAGGITQHIGAYEVEVKGKKITFLDTPGHEAFTAMRARGAKVTDIVIIIIAADDRLMPQTKEAISHAQAAGVPMVFAINKIDKDGADPERIKQELASMNLLVEDWGGKFQSQDISAKAGTNIDQLLEKITLEAEVLDLKANPNRQAMGTVVEASLDKGRGYVTKLLVQTGSLKIGDSIVAGGHSGKVKAMFNEKGKKVKVAGPSTPVLVLGLSGAPQAGEKFKIVDSEQEARQLATKRSQISREQTNRASKRISLDEIGRRLALGTFKELNLIVKGDVDGSIEALSDALIKLSVETIQVNVIHKAVGPIAESDVLLASASDAIIIGFQVRPTGGARNLAEKEGVQVKTYSIIYEAIDEIKLAMEGMLEPTKEEKVTCQVEVRETYKISRIGTIAGCYVQEGVVTRNTLIRLVRDGIVVFPVKEGVVGELTSLKRFKDDAKEVKKGLECGLTIKNYNDIKEGDIIEGYEIVEVKQTLDSKKK